MCTNYQHIHPDVLPILELENKERINFLYQDKWIGYDKANKVIGYLDELIQRPRVGRPQNLLLISEGNNGKSALINHFAEMHPNYSCDNNEEGITKSNVPVIIIEVSKADPKQFYQAIVKQFWAPFKRSATLQDLKHQAEHLIELCNVKMLIIDEVHSLLTGAPSMQEVVMNEIKYLGNEKKIIIIGSGTKAALRVLKTSSQMISRFDTIKLPKWELDREFIKLLKGYESILPLKKPSNLNQKELATKLFSTSQGNMGNLNMLLTVCAQEAISSGEERITEAILCKFEHFRPTRTGRTLEL